MLEFRILAKRQELRDLLRYALEQSPVNLSMIRQLRAEISICDLALRELAARRVRRSALNN